MQMAFWLALAGLAVFFVVRRGDKPTELGTNPLNLSPFQKPASDRTGMAAWKRGKYPVLPNELARAVAAKAVAEARDNIHAGIQGMAPGEESSGQKRE